MLSFAVYSGGKPAETVNLAGAYVVGNDDVPLRAEISYRNGVISCSKRNAGPSGLVLPWRVQGRDTIPLDTVRLLDRSKPYILQIELARGRLLHLHQKFEEWGLIGYPGTDEMASRVAAARDALIAALKTEAPAAAAEKAEESLALSVKVGEELARFHADVLLQRRRQSSGFPRRMFGCGVSLATGPDAGLLRRISAAFDYVTLPIIWRDIEPTEQTFQWKTLDVWVEALSKHRVTIKGSSLLSFQERNVPDWLHTWQHDFDALRDLAFEHARRVLNRYAQYIPIWDVVSGLHGNNCFSFTFEQIMELTRMTAALAKQTAPRATTVVNLVSPWGEYYARNQRTIPPLLYADMTVQSGVNFDAFGIRLDFGDASEENFVRDAFQISSLLDQFSRLSRPLHITAIRVPAARSGARVGGDNAGKNSRSAQGEWSESAQAEWLRRTVEIALSKPFVDSISWQTLTDEHGASGAPTGMLHSDFSPRASYLEWQKLRKTLASEKNSEVSSAARES